MDQISLIAVGDKMKPFKNINVGDIYKSLEYIVLQKDKDDS